MKKVCLAVLRILSWDLKEALAVPTMVLDVTPSVTRNWSNEAELVNVPALHMNPKLPAGVMGVASVMVTSQRLGSELPSAHERLLNVEPVTLKRNQYFVPATRVIVELDRVVDEPPDLRPMRSVVALDSWQ